MNVSTYLYIFLCVYVCMYVHICMCMYVCMYTYVYVCMYVCTRMDGWKDVCVCMYKMQEIFANGT
jgi:hypothetical protein